MLFGSAKKRRHSEVAPIVDDLLNRLESTQDEDMRAVAKSLVDDDAKKEKAVSLKVPHPSKKSQQCDKTEATEESVEDSFEESALAFGAIRFSKDGDIKSPKSFEQIEKNVEHEEDNEDNPDNNEIDPKAVFEIMTRQQTLRAEQEKGFTGDDSDNSFVSVLEETEVSRTVADPIFEKRTPSSPQRRPEKRKLPPAFRHCAGCTVEDEVASVWCCECARCLCTACDNRMHDTNALDALRRPMCSHRVEVIVDGGGLPILSPLLEMAILAGAVAAFRPLLTGAGTMLNVEYFFESVCPIVQKIRRLVFRVDHALFPIFRSTLGHYCDIEDSFIKIFVDVWVRGVLTSTDSFALLIMKTPSTIGALVIVLTITPLLAIPYAILATSVRLLELFLFRNWLIVRVIARIIRLVSFVLWLPCRIAGWLCRSTVLGLVMDNDYRQHFHRRTKIPPKTGHRLRPTPSDGIEDISLGAITRITRIFWYFHRKARRAIVGAVITAVFLAVIVRVVLLSLPRCGNGILSTSTQQQMWNMLSSGDQDDVAEAPPKCLSIHAVVRKLAKKIGVKTPDFDSLGDEGFILAKMQDATDDDYIDLILRRACMSIGRHFMRFPTFLRVSVFAILLVVVFAGVLRRLVFWADLKRRYRYRRLRDEILRNAGQEVADATDDESTSTHDRHDDKESRDAEGSKLHHDVPEDRAVNVKHLSIPRLMKMRMKMKLKQPAASKKQTMRPE